MPDYLDDYDVEDLSPLAQPYTSDYAQQLAGEFRASDVAMEQETQRRASENLANRSEFTRALMSGLDQLQATGYGFLGAIRSGMGDAYGARQSFQGYQEQMRQAAENPRQVTDFFSRDPGRGAFASPGNLATYALGTIGEAAPSVAFSIGTGGTGALAAKGIAAAAGKSALQSQAKKILGAKIGVVLGSSLLEGGSSYGELKEKGIDAPGSSILFGILSGATEVSLGATPRVLKLFTKGAGGKLVKQAAKRGPAAAAAALWEVAKDAGRTSRGEALQEGLQEVINSVNQEINDPNFKITSKETFMRWAEAAAAGGTVGLALGVPAAIKTAWQNSRAAAARGENPVDMTTGKPKLIPPEQQLGPAVQQEALPPSAERAALPSAERAALPPVTGVQPVEGAQPSTEEDIGQALRTIAAENMDEAQGLAEAMRRNPRIIARRILQRAAELDAAASSLSALEQAARQQKLAEQGEFVPTIEDLGEAAGQGPTTIDQRTQQAVDTAAVEQARAEGRPTRIGDVLVAPPTQVEVTPDAATTQVGADESELGQVGPGIAEEVQAPGEADPIGLPQVEEAQPAATIIHSMPDGSIMAGPEHEGAIPGSERTVQLQGEVTPGEAIAPEQVIEEVPSAEEITRQVDEAGQQVGVEEQPQEGIRPRDVAKSKAKPKAKVAKKAAPKKAKKAAAPTPKKAPAPAKETKKAPAKKKPSPVAKERASTRELLEEQVKEGNIKRLPNGKYRSLNSRGKTILAQIRKEVKAAKEKKAAPKAAPEEDLGDEPKFRSVWEESSPADKVTIRKMWRKLFGNENIEFVERVISQGREFAGKYQKAWTTIATGKGNPQNTALHEAVHQAIDMFLTPSEKARLFDAFKGNEEAIAEGIIEFANKRRGVAGRVRGFAAKVVRNLKKFFGPAGNMDRVNEFYDNLLSGFFAKRGQVVESSGEVKFRPSEEEYKAVGKQTTIGGRIREFAGRANELRKKGLGPVLSATGETIQQSAIGKAVGYAITTISNRLESISPELFRKTRKLMSDIAQLDVDTLKVHKKVVDVAKTMSKEDQERFDYARQDSDEVEIARLIKKYGPDLDKANSELRKMLDDYLDMLAEVGIDVPRRKNYHPRVVTDHIGLITELKGTSNWSYIQNEIDKRNRALGPQNKMTTEEEAEIANKMLQGTIPGLPAGRTKNTKQRVVSHITPEMRQYYMSSDDALASYIRENNRLIAWRKLFGRLNPEATAAMQLAKRARVAIETWNQRMVTAAARRENLALSEAQRKKADTTFKRAEAKMEEWTTKRDEALEAAGLGGATSTEAAKTMEDSIGSLVQKLGLDAEKEAQVKKLMQALWDDSGIKSPILSVYRDLTLAGALGQVSSAVTQIGDLAWSFYENGIWNTSRAVGKAVAKKSGLKKSDILADINPEFKGGKAGGYILSKILKWTGMEYMDSLGKEVLANASLEKTRGLIKRYKAGDKSVEPKLRESLEKVFGDEWYNNMAELMSGDPKNETVREFAHFMLSEYQPINRLETPAAYKGNARFFYMLKTYQIKQLNNYRAAVVRRLRTATTNKQRLGALKDLAKMGAWLAAMGLTADVIKDILYGRELKPEEITLDVLGQMAGATRWDVMNVRREGLSGAVLKRFVPQAKIIDSVIKDLTQSSEQGYRTPTLLPVVGKFYNNRWGRASKRDKKKGKSKSSGGFGKF